MNTEPRPCNSCKATGLHIREAFSHNGTTYPESRRPCYTCNGAGTMPAPCEATIRAAIKGRKPGSIRSARPKDRRAYYVWRMARFHGGVDVTLPVMAAMNIGGDPWVKELDALADKVAREAFGSDLRGAMRWHRAMYGT